MKYSTKYDELIKGAAIDFLFFIPGVSWLQWKAQLIAESNLDGNAISPVGAIGVAQIMPATWEDIRSYFNWERSAINVPYFNIYGGAWYMGHLWDEWSAKRKEKDRLDLARASYNAGLGNVLEAQEKSGGKNEAKKILDSLYLVTGNHAKETLNYVRKCRKIYGELINE